VDLDWGFVGVGWGVVGFLKWITSDWGLGVWGARAD